MLRLMECEFLKLKRRPLVFISLVLSVFMPLAYVFFLSDVNTDVDAVNGVMSSLFQLSAYLLLMPLLVILASSLYPFSAALVLAGFDLSGYAGMTAAPDLGLAAAGVGVMVLWTGLLLLRSRKKKEMRPRRQASARGKARRAAPL